MLYEYNNNIDVKIPKKFTSGSTVTAGEWYYNGTEYKYCTATTSGAT